MSREEELLVRRGDMVRAVSKKELNRELMAFLFKVPLTMSGNTVRLRDLVELATELFVESPTPEVLRAVENASGSLAALIDSHVKKESAFVKLLRDYSDQLLMLLEGASANEEKEGKVPEVEIPQYAGKYRVVFSVDALGSKWQFTVGDDKLPYFVRVKLVARPKFAPDKGGPITLRASDGATHEVILPFCKYFVDPTGNDCVFVKYEDVHSGWMSRPKGGEFFRPVPGVVVRMLKPKGISLNRPTFPTIGPGSKLSKVRTFANVSSPYSVAVKPNGDFVVAEYNNHRIHILNAEGASQGQVGCSNYPVSVAVTSSGVVYVANYSPKKLTRVSEQNTVSEMGPLIGGGNGSAVCELSDGTIAFAHGNPACVSFFPASGGNPRTFITTHSNISCVSEAPGAQLLLCADSNVFLYEMNGTLIKQFTGKGPSQINISSPGRALMNPDGALLISDSSNLHVVNAAGAIVHSLQLNGTIYSLTALPDGRIAVARSDQNAFDIVEVQAAAA